MPKPVEAPSSACHVDVDWLAEEAVSLASLSTATPRCSLVVGGSGLLGANLVVLLAKTPGCEFVRVLDVKPPSLEVLEAAPKVEFVHHRLGGDGTGSEQDIAKQEEELLNALDGVDCVFSTVTPHVQHATESDFYSTNITGVQRLVDVCLKKGVTRLVHLSSIAVTSHFIASVHQTEDQLLPSLKSYESPYDISKRHGEDWVLDANGTGKLSTCSLRAGGIFLSPWDFVFANLWPIIPGLIIQPWGKKIDFIDGRDVCCAMLLAAQGLEDKPEKVAGEAFFITKGESWHPGEIAKYGAQQLGLPFLIVPDWAIHIAYVLVWMFHMTRKNLGLCVPGIPPHRFLMMLFNEMTFDNSKAHNVLGWSPKVKLCDSIDRIIELYQNQRGPASRPRNIMFSHLLWLVLALSLVPFIMPSALTWH